ELLRYIADAGDNSQIDADYWQARLSARIGNAPPEWGPRGPCEEEVIIGSRGSTFQPIEPRENCGNYYVANNEGQLVLVFNEIASRMFTRLSQ
ncbi:MAG: hypothetical protein SGJ24_15995, partial [Chloroflexota bacterium]|nr:hypothetical protein [Chloroflexota bacterium]